jgi:prolyl-tRNA synthetase
MLNLYAQFCEEVLAIPMVKGRKTDKEKFAGAEATYTIEALMHDGKALQSGTSHNFGDGFARAFNIQYTDKDNKLSYVYQTSWGMTTRLIGAVIMVHGDDNGLVLPPKIAPVQVVVVPIAQHKEGVLEKAQELTERLSGFCRVKADVTENSAGWKFAEYEMKGVPLRLEIGPKDIENGVATVMRRDTFEKSTISLDNLAEELKKLLDDIQQNMFRIADEFRLAHTKDVHNYDELKAQVEGGYARAMWCGDRACEDKIKEETNATSRNMPFDQTPFGDTCVCCGKKAKTLVYWGKAY